MCKKCFFLFPHTPFFFFFKKVKDKEKEKDKDKEKEQEKENIYRASREAKKPFEKRKIYES